MTKKSVGELYQDHCEWTGQYYHATNVVQQLTILIRDEVDLLNVDAGEFDYEPVSYLEYLADMLNRWASIVAEEKAAAEKEKHENQTW